MKKTHLSLILCIGLMSGSCINIIKPMNYQYTHTNEVSAECPICFEALTAKNFRLLQCGDAFCTTCINTWKRSRGNKLCPLCREEIMESDHLTYTEWMQIKYNKNTSNRPDEVNNNQASSSNFRPRQEFLGSNHNQHRFNPYDNIHNINNNISLAKKLISCGFILGLGYFGYKYFFDKKNNNNEQSN